MKTLADRYRFFRKHAGYRVGHAAECALALARAEARAERAGLATLWNYDDLPWDGDCPAPEIIALATVRDPYDARWAIASLGGIGLVSWSDPYRRVVDAELFLEALDYLDARADKQAHAYAREVMTYAGTP